MKSTIILLEFSVPMTKSASYKGKVSLGPGEGVDILNALDRIGEM